MTLLSKTIAETRDVLQRNKQAQDNKSDSKKTETNLKRVKAAIESVHSHIQIARYSARAFDQCCDTTGSHIEPLLGLITTLYQELDDRAMADDTIQRLTSLATEIVKDSENAWKTTAQEKTGSMVAMLEAFQSFTPNPQRTRMLIQEIKIGAKSFPTGTDRVDAFCTIHSEGTQIIKQMRIDPKVNDFLLKVNARKATLADLDETILQWLKENNLLPRLSISISAF